MFLGEPFANHYSASDAWAGGTFSEQPIIGLTDGGGISGAALILYPWKFQ